MDRVKFGAHFFEIFNCTVVALDSRCYHITLLQEPSVVGGSG
jgi:hypothetical protein